MLNIIILKSDLSSVRVQVYSNLHWQNHFLQGARKTGPGLYGRVVQRLLKDF